MRYRVINLTNGNRKEIIELQDKMEAKRYKRKIDFTTFLYKLKNDFLNNEEDAKMRRLKIKRLK